MRGRGWRSRRRLALCGGALLALGALAGASVYHGAPARGAGTLESSGRPNIVVVMTDDQDADSVRYMSNVRALAAMGATFRNSFTTFSQCCPSRATFLTGQYAHNHGVFGNVPPLGGYAKLDHSRTLPVWLQRAGYHTVQIGKYLNGYGGERPSTEVPPGWHEWNASIEAPTYQFYGYTLNENGKLVTYGTDEGSYQTDLFARRAVDFIRQRGRERSPFFLYVSFLAPHEGGPIRADDPPGFGTPDPAPRHRGHFASLPLPKPASFNESDVSDKPTSIRSLAPLTQAEIDAVTSSYRQRLESLLAVDEAVAAIVAALREQRLLANTLIIFTSDNGYFHGEHRIPRGKVLLYEPSIRVPLILRGPGVRPGRRLDDLVGNIDLAPTILAAARATAGRRLDGRSLLALARGQGRLPSRDLLIERGPLGGATGHVFTAVRTRNFLYAEYADGQQELYDLVRDPGQLVSRHADPAYATIRNALAQRLARLRICAGSTC